MQYLRLIVIGACVLLSGCTETRQFTPAPAPAQHQLQGLPANAVDVQVHDRRTDTTMRDALPQVLKAHLVASLSPKPTLAVTNRYHLVIDIIEHRAIFTPGSPYWSASTRFRTQLLESDGKALGQWDAIGSARRWNWSGYATAQAVAQESYNIAVADLLSSLAPVSYASKETLKPQDTSRSSAPFPLPAAESSAILAPPLLPSSVATQNLDGENIALVKKEGVYQLPVEINEVITLRFILDTGASDVNIPADVALTLLRTGTILDADFLPGKMYTLADGSTVKSPRFLLRSLKVGSRRVTNVTTSIGPISGALLLGQSFLEKLGTWGIDSQRHVLTLGISGQRIVPVQQ